ncbi:adenosylhomocysteinase [Candidatus Gottesmanbacteria bacterium]|nr:adenosylhomocysteinase [Candidatus Gottesmanbacteria bacterium]
MSKVKDSSLSSMGRKRVQWAKAHMPVVAKIAEDFSERKPFRGLTVAISLHVTKETAVLVEAISSGGARIALCGCNPLSTQDEVAAALSELPGVEVFAWRGQTNKEYYDCINDVLEFSPDITIDDGCDLISQIHTNRRELIKKIRGGCEETTMGVNRLRAMEKDGALKYPVIAVNDAYTKYLFDNRYGTGQSTIDGILRATSVLFAGKTVVVVGYGWCGKGITMRSSGMGANVVVVEVDPIRALEAVMDGYRVMGMNEAAKVGDIFVTATGNTDVINLEHIKRMKNGVILANAGHLDREIKVSDLKKLARKVERINDVAEIYELDKDRKIYLLGEGRIINLVAAEGHPSEVMDTSFATQALSCEYINKNYKKLEPRVYITPREQDEKIARMKLESMGIYIDTLTSTQKKYLSDWREGT